MDESEHALGWTGTAVGMLAVALAFFPGAPDLPPLAAAAPRMLEIHVETAEGRALAGVSVRFLEGERTTTDSAGNASLPFRAGMIEADAPAFALARRTVGADDARVDFRLQPARRLEGSVVNVERAPIANASIELWSV
ncbi:MAG: hypothetical protein AAGE52_39485, partial [Myxococcota bacterium]